MRKQISILLSTFFALGIAAGPAVATNANLQFTDLSGETSPDAVIDGNDISGLQVGDRFEVSIFVDNTEGDAVTDLFTFVIIDPTVLSVVQGVGLEILDEGIFGVSLTPLSGFGDQAIGNPEDTRVGLAHGVVGPGASTAPGPDQAVLLVFELISAGNTSISQSESGNSTINGIDQGPNFGPNITVTVPEPGAFTAALGALAALSGVIVVRRRSALV